MLATVIGGSLSAGSAAAFNMYLDRDIDAHMQRTENRPLVTGEVTPRGALVFSWTLAVRLDRVARGHHELARRGAVGRRDLLLRRDLHDDPQAPHRAEHHLGRHRRLLPRAHRLGGRHRSLDWPPFILFAVVFLWTPPHYWPLSMKYRDDYEAVDVPMLAVTRGRSQVGPPGHPVRVGDGRLFAAADPGRRMGLVYTVVAVVSGGWFIYETHRLYNQAIRGTRARPMRVFHASITYLTLLFVAVGVDPLLPF